MITGLSSQPTDLLLQQLMAEMKYPRERVDTLPTGPASLQTSPEVLKPSSQTFSSFEDMEVTEQTALSCPQAAVPARLSETSTSNGKPSGFQDGVFSCADPETC
jgi:hypothetical protein